MENNELISVIVPIYNVEKYLEKCIITIINQTYKDIEIILVNDGSTDNSNDICEKYRKLDKRIKYIKKDNGGLSSARNVGIDNSCGEYLVFVDSDDYIADTMIEKLYNSIKLTNTDISICGYFEFFDDGKFGKGIVESDLHLLEQNKCFDYMVRGQASLLMIVSWNKLYKKKVFDSLRFPVGKIHEDEFVAHKIYDNVGKISIVNECLYFYRKREGSIMTMEKLNNRLDASEAFLERLEYFYKNKYNFCYEAFFLVSVSYMADTYLSSKKMTDVEKERYGNLLFCYKNLWNRKKHVKSMKRKIFINLFFINNNINPNKIKKLLNLK